MSNSDPDLHAAISSFRINTNNMSDEFERAAGFLIAICPYEKHQNESGNSTSNIRGANLSDSTLRGKYSSNIGVYLRWHKRDEYAELSPEQKH